MLPNVIASRSRAQKCNAKMLQNPIQVDSPAVSPSIIVTSDQMRQLYKRSILDWAFQQFLCISSRVVSTWAFQISSNSSH